MWLPKFLFKFQTIPITLPKSFFKDVNSTLSSFIWSNKVSRLKRKLLHYPKEEGGLNLPNLEVYHVAAQMFYVDRIINNTNEDPWIEIENNQLQKNSLLVALFSRDRVKSTNFIINSTLNAWNKIKGILGQEIGLPRHIQIWNNPSINIQNSQLQWDMWSNRGIQKISDIIRQNSVIPFQELKSQYHLKDVEVFRYMQLKNWINSNFDLSLQVNPELSTLLNKEGKRKKLIGSVYNILIKKEGSDQLLEDIYNKWTEDLGYNIKDKWKDCLTLSYKITTNENLRLIQF